MIKKILNQKNVIYFGLSFIVIFIYLFPYFDFNNRIVRSHDNLDSYYYYYTIIAKNTYFFELQPLKLVEEILNGLPRFCLPSQLNFVALFFNIFGPEVGYVINLCVIHNIGYIGMFFFLKKYVFQKNQILFVHLLALTFALLPIFPLWGLSVLGLPLLAYSILNILTEKFEFKNWIILFVFPFYSHLVFSGIFLLALIGVFGIAYSIKHPIYFYNFIKVILVLSIGYIIAEFQMIYGIFFLDFESHRNDELSNNLSTFELMRTSILTLLKGNYHSALYLGFWFFPFILLTILVAFFKNIPFKNICLGIIICCFFAVLSNISDWKYFATIAQGVDLLQKFSIKRFHFLLPFFVFCTFAMAIEKMYIFKMIRYLSAIILCFSMLISFSLRDQFDSNKFKINIPFTNKNQTSSFENHSISTYFDKELYSAIAQQINKPKKSYRVVSLDISPSKLIYNGFYSLSGFQNIYDKSYSETFFKINEKELSKTIDIPNKIVEGDKTIKYQQMGNQCYLYSSEILNNNVDKIKNYEGDIKILYNLGCEYIFSSREILNHGEIHLTEVGRFRSKLSDTKVFVYNLCSVEI